MDDLRKAIRKGTLADFAGEFLAHYPDDGRQTTDH